MALTFPSSAQFELMPVLQWENCKDQISTKKMVSIAPMTAWFDGDTGYPLHVLEWWLEEIKHLGYSVAGFYSSYTLQRCRDFGLESSGDSVKSSIMHCSINMSRSHNPNIHSESEFTSTGHWKAEVQLGGSRIGVLTRSTFDILDLEKRVLYARLRKYAVSAPGGIGELWVKESEMKFVKHHANIDLQCIPSSRTSLAAHQTRVTKMLSKRIDAHLMARAEVHGVKDLTEIEHILVGIVREVSGEYSKRTSQYREVGAEVLKGLSSILDDIASTPAKTDDPAGVRYLALLYRLAAFWYNFANAQCGYTPRVAAGPYGVILYEIDHWRDVISKFRTLRECMHAVRTSVNKLAQAVGIKDLGV